MVDLSLHILDIATNSFKANATLVKVIVKKEDNCIKMWIKDNGCGMDDKILKDVMNPFYTTRTTRKVGLGIPLFKQTLEQTGGFLEITSKLNEGTNIYGLMYTNHIDAIPLGDLSETIFVLVTNPYDIDIYFEMIYQESEKASFIFDTREIKKVLNGIPLNENSVMIWIKEYISEGLNP